MSTPVELLIASENPGKIKEIKNLFIDTNLKTLVPKEVWDSHHKIEIKESGKTYSDNAVIKALAFGKYSGLLTLADDSGLEVDYLNGLPGIKSHRFAKTDKQRISKVLAMMDQIPWEKRTARFKVVMSLYQPNTGKTILFHGSTEGFITEKPIGNKGFGYDPIFYSRDLGKTFSQATIEEKNRVSHRARALFKLKEFISKEYL